MNIKIKSYIRNIFFLFFVCFIIYQINLNLEFILSNIFNNYYTLLLAILAYVSIFQLISVKSFYALKKGFKFKKNFKEWSQIFYESIIIQETILSHVGFVYRSFFLKRNGLNVNKIVSFFTLLTFIFISTNFILIYLELNFFGAIKMKHQFHFFLIFILIIFSPKILIEILKINFFKKINILKKVIKSLKKVIIKIREIIKNKVLFLNLIYFEIIIHFHYLILFFLSISFLSLKIELPTIIIMFGVSFLIDRLPFISSIPGLRESVFAILTTTVGLNFYEGFFIKLFLRILSLISLSINYLIIRAINRIK